MIICIFLFFFWSCLLYLSFILFDSIIFLLLLLFSFNLFLLINQTSTICHSFLLFLLFRWIFLFNPLDSLLIRFRKFWRLTSQYLGNINIGCKIICLCTCASISITWNNLKIFLIFWHHWYWLKTCYRWR